MFILIFSDRIKIYSFVQDTKKAFLNKLNWKWVSKIPHHQYQWQSKPLKMNEGKYK